jgi:hypothetical protein
VIIDSTNITIEDSQIGPCGGNGINIYNNSAQSSQIYIYDSYIHPETHTTNCCDYNDGIFVQDGVSQVTVQGNVIAYSESNVAVVGVKGGSGVNSVTVTGNFLLNPLGGNPSSRGQNVLVTYASTVDVQNNYALSSTNTTTYKYAENQEDSINFENGTGVTATDNYVTGGHSSSGCGIIADGDANSAQFTYNELVNTGECGIGIASGTNQSVENNKAFETNPISGGGNTAIYVWNQYSVPCGPVVVSNNIAVFKNTDGTYNSFWNGGGCGTVTLTDDTWDAAAFNILNPPATTMPSPLIPPQPKNCVAKSPYSTQTGWAGCQ